MSVEPPIGKDTAPQESNPLAVEAHAYLLQCCMGFVAAHQGGGVPVPASWSALVQGFGRVISTVSMSDNLSATLAVRAKAKEQFKKEVDKFSPAIQPGASFIHPNGRA